TRAPIDASSIATINDNPLPKSAQRSCRCSAINTGRLFMTTTSKIILGFSVASIGFSFTEIGAHVYYGIIRPIGAVAFVVFYLVNMLGKEMRKFDEDHPAQTTEPTHLTPR